ncbi:FkbM family methyltransferase [Pseudomonas sp. L5B5]|uniref:FkbM family methyltransferase n=1 Tax=Pseudomonas sp. L5B5 TaxID=2883205 RepID=UPI001CF95E87|nr:FkbM family methyltransferase [Pseudomonas sp. L5B5]UCZ86723.1 FkbM family methyltransferase [Pseudomonas sp. L5B5]
MPTSYAGIKRLEVAGSYENLVAIFQLAVAAYQQDPRFCLSPEACHVYDASGSDTKVVLLGTTQFSQLFINEAAGKAQIVAVVDDFKVGKMESFHGVPVISSDAFLKLAHDTPLISINGCRYDYSRRYFKSLTLRNAIPMLNFEQALRLFVSGPASDHRIDDWGGYIVAHAEEFFALGKRLDDDYSRFTLFSVLLGHLTCDPEWILNAAKPYLTLYFRSGLWLPGQNERFADCGASIAESAKAFLDATDGRFQKIWMIEPDEVNQATIRSFIQGYSDALALPQSGVIELLGCAVSNEDGQMPFLHEGGHGGHLLASATDQAICRNVQVRRLDAILDDSPTLIKMDIEGAELQALQGACGHISQGRPKLAISAYHRASDLLEITRYVESLRADYKIGLRHHTEERWDTCLYFY